MNSYLLLNFEVLIERYTNEKNEIKMIAAWFKKPWSLTNGIYQLFKSNVCSAEFWHFSPDTVFVPRTTRHLQVFQELANLAGKSFNLLFESLFYTCIFCHYSITFIMIRRSEFWVFVSTKFQLRCVDWRFDWIVYLFITIELKTKFEPKNTFHRICLTILPLETKIGKTHKSFPQNWLNTNWLELNWRKIYLN